MSEYKLSDIFDLQMGKTPARNNLNYWNDGSNDWVSIADMSTYSKYVGKTKETISNIGVEKSGIKIVPSNTVIMSFKLSLGKVAITTTPVFTNEAIMAFIDKGKIPVLTDYIYYLFSAMDWTRGTNKAVKGITLNKTTLNEYRINVPLLYVQKRIADILDHTTALIEKRKAQIVKLDLLVKSQFIKMFGDPISNSMGWEKRPFRATCDITTGNTPPRANQEYYGDYIEWIKTDNIHVADYVLTPALEYLSEQGFAKCRFVEADSILMTCIAGSLSSIGNVAITDRRVAFNQQINALTPREYDCLFLYWLLKLIKTEIHSSVNMMLKGILSKGNLAEIKAIVPPIDTQNSFVNFARSADKTKAEMKCSLIKLELLYKALVKKCFNGNL